MKITFESFRIIQDFLIILMQQGSTNKKNIWEIYIFLKNSSKYFYSFDYFF